MYTEEPIVGPFGALYNGEPASIVLAPLSRALDTRRAPWRVEAPRRDRDQGANGRADRQTDRDAGSR